MGIDSINTQMAHFFWNNLEEGRGKYHLANWQVMAKKKNMGAWDPWYSEHEFVLADLMDFKVSLEGYPHVEEDHRIQV